MSVYDKTGLDELARGLSSAGVEIVSTGSTAARIAALGVPVTQVSEVTGFPETLDGRVKTLHPAVHAGILADLRLEEHQQQIDELGIAAFELVVVNLYPFVETVASGATPDECIEQIDIGGPTMVRAAAKNHPSVAVVTSPTQYADALTAVTAGGFTLEQRQRLAAAAFVHTANYDVAVASWLGNVVAPSDEGTGFPAWIGATWERAEVLRYGENPHQRAALYVTQHTPNPGLAQAEQLSGKEMSYNNYVDADAARRAAYDHSEPAVAIIKHANPCGIAIGADIAEAHRLANDTDPVSAFGGVIAANRPVTADMARQVAEEGIVLLKNENQLLPLDATKLKTIAVIGENAARLHAHGGDSSGIKAFYEVNPLDGIVKRAGGKVNVIYSEGYRKGGGADLAERAVAAAKAADAVIYIGGLNHDKGFDCEGADRKDMKLPYGQDELISKIVTANPKTIVVLEGTMVEMDAWLGKVPALLQVWYPGMEGGNALAKVLFGDVNPSGKLPATFPKKLSDSPAHALGNYPGTNGTVTYAEGLLVGYRWFDTKNIEPLFPFGFGLSYTTFKYSGLKLIPATGTNEVVTAQFEIENTGKVGGAEVAQLYVHQKNPALMRPEKELKGFKKVFLQPGEKQTVSIPLKKSAFEYYDDGKKSWVTDDDSFEILIGSSSRDFRLRDSFHPAVQKQHHAKVFNLFPPYYAWNNKFTREEIGWHPGTEEAPQWTANFNFATNGLYGYPASIRGWHYGWNPTEDNLFPKKLSDTTSISCAFSYNCGGDDLHGDFAYDLFLRNDDKKSVPQLEVMVWAGNNSTPIGEIISTNIIKVEDVSFDLWAGTNAPAGYYVYSFMPHERTAKLPAESSLNADMMDFLRLLEGRPYFSKEMYLDVVEAGFEIVRGRGWVTCGWFSCEAE